MNETLRDKLARFARSASVGLLASAIDVVALLVLVELLGLSAEVANVPALGLGLLAQFVGNKYFAFRDRSRALVRQGARFAAVEVGALLLNALSFHLVVHLTTLSYVLSRLLCSAGVYAVYSFPLWGLVFRPGAGPRQSAQPLTDYKETEPCSTPTHC